MCALTLLTLAAALLGAACLSSRAVEHRGRVARGSIIADALARRALAYAVAEWDARADALSFGESLDRALPGDAVNGFVRVRITRVGARLHVVIVEARAGAETDATRRRMRVIVEHASIPDSTNIDTGARPIARWSVSELY